MTEVEIAERIAREAHAGQVDKQGQPYILHVERVAAAVSEPAKAAAWLHDVLEDTAVTFDDMRAAGVGHMTCCMVNCLTRGHAGYGDYIERIADTEHDETIEIKLADLRDNLRGGCPETLRARYLKAIERLERA